jgi:hypothetical protein
MFHFDPWGLSKDENHNTVPWTEWPIDADNASKYHWRRTGCQFCERRQGDYR